ncbi:MAG TPA: hypothetical protein VK527_03235 [Candidatus Limnocylindrales bacterium]|nr:hypothetical protein [Candidatus Limnocylindrales bacterium]
MNIRLPGSALVLLAAWAVLAMPAPARCNQLATGSIEFSPAVSFTHSNMKREGYGNVDTFTRLEITPTIGYCLSNHYEVTGGVMTRHESTNGTSETNLGALAGLTYNFSPRSTLIPYASLGFGALFYDGFSLTNTAVLAPMLTGGVRVLVGSSASVNATLGYQHESNAQGEFGASANRLVAGVGVSLFPWQARQGARSAEDSGRRR